MTKTANGDLAHYCLEGGNRVKESREKEDMGSQRICATVMLMILLCPFSILDAADDAGKLHLLVIDSYHREYLWSQYTNEGFCASMLELGYFDNMEQAKAFTREDHAESSKMVIRKLWMDTKRERERSNIAKKVHEFKKIAGEFNPDLIFLGDDNATEYIGNQFLDSGIPIVFWGLNSNPVKYGLLDSAERPGHNVTGVYQPGFYAESLQLLKTIVPSATTMAAVSDNSETGRVNCKNVHYLAQKGQMPFILTEVYMTSEFEKWKEKILELQGNVDALYLGHYASLRDRNGQYVPPDKVAEWYVAHSKIPDVMNSRQFIEQGILCGVDDSGFKQGYEAVRIAHDILSGGSDPAAYPPVAPPRGPLIANRQRARMLGIALTEEMGVEEYVERISSVD